MAVPKKRTGKSAQAKRRANWKATVPATTTCSNCGSIVLTHTVCPECGFYKGKAVSIKNEKYGVEAEAKQETKEETKAEKPKRTRKKAEPAMTETIEVKAEEVKEETEATAEKEAE